MQTVCERCSAQATHGFANETLKRCSRHALLGMTEKKESVEKSADNKKRGMNEIETVQVVQTEQTRRTDV